MFFHRKVRTFATETRTATRCGSISSDCGSFARIKESKIRIAKLRNFLFVSGNSSEMKTESIYSQDNRSAHTRGCFSFPFRSFVETPTLTRAKIFNRGKNPLTNFAFIHPFSRRCFYDCVSVVHPSPTTRNTSFIFMVNYTNTNEPLILLNSYDARSDAVLFYDAIYYVEHSMLA